MYHIKWKYQSMQRLNKIVKKIDICSATRSLTEVDIIGTFDYSRQLHEITGLGNCLKDREPMVGVSNPCVELIEP